MLALESLLKRQEPHIVRFLKLATQTPAINTTNLQEQDIPLYCITDWIRRLNLANEISELSWCTGIREQYHDLLSHIPADKTNPTTHQGPREKAEFTGIASLNDFELIALLLRTGQRDEHVLQVAQRLYEHNDGLPGLAQCSIEDLVDQAGIGTAKAAEIAAAFELGRRLLRAKRLERPALRSPQQVVDLVYAELSPLAHEEFWCLPMDSRAQLCGIPRMVSTGDIDGTDAGPRAFFRAALRAKAVACIAVHNHPTGLPQPSIADRKVTKRLRSAGALLDCPLEDHIIIGDGGDWYSFRQREPELFIN